MQRGNTMDRNEQWLQWVVELQSLAQAGLTYCKDVYDKERYERIREISAEVLAHMSDIPIEKVKDLFCNEIGYQTPKLDTRGAIFEEEKNNEEQIKMCFEAHRSKEWKTLFD